MMHIREKQQGQGRAAPLLSGLSLRTRRHIEVLLMPLLEFSWVVISLYSAVFAFYELSRVNIAFQPKCSSFRFRKVYLHMNAIKP